ncbi:hypothetical protein FB45DRAFT_1064784 [Roridomyces roridus]|uniref:Uncharacterized protein n=1 Tax=Roridomyces roridus TaxID=1738132 RepID=A0AAD7B9Z9_9AGAR|nr:hypothetical protein FB45DRAFT_1065077 [Roridomyces roridus]KAJ7614574.1 hypothetical protein FB45DRAFT_1064784 [Roridomyces roridus]
MFNILFFLVISTALAGASAIPHSIHSFDTRQSADCQAPCTAVQALLSVSPFEIPLSLIYQVPQQSFNPDTDACSTNAANQVSDCVTCVANGAGGQIPTDLDSSLQNYEHACASIGVAISISGDGGVSVSTPGTNTGGNVVVNGVTISPGQPGQVDPGQPGQPGQVVQGGGGATIPGQTIPGQTISIPGQVFTVPGSTISIAGQTIANPGQTVPGVTVAGATGGAGNPGSSATATAQVVNASGKPQGDGTAKESGSGTASSDSASPSPTGKKSGAAKFSFDSRRPLYTLVALGGVFVVLV